jgi:hypothetical protein
MAENITDAMELVNRFNLAQLRHEAHMADVRGRPDWDDYGYWTWYKEIVETAIQIKIATAPKPVVRYGYVDLQSVRDHADIVAILQDYGIKLTKAGKNFKGLCPFHTEKTPSFMVYADQNRYHCYGCQAHGDFIDLIMKLDNVGFREAVAKC